MKAFFKWLVIWSLAFIIGLIIFSPAHAQVSVWGHGVSFHPEGANWNEKNWGLGVRYEFTPEWSAQVGFYKNSYSRRSEYALAQWQPLAVGPVRLGAFAGYLSGYRLRYPLGAGLMATVEVTPRLLLGVRHVPKVQNLTTSVTALDIGWRF